MLAKVLKFVIIFLVFLQKNDEICVKINEILAIGYQSKFSWVNIFIYGSSDGFLCRT